MLKFILLFICVHFVFIGISQENPSKGGAGVNGKKTEAELINASQNLKNDGWFSLPNDSSVLKMVSERADLMDKKDPHGVQVYIHASGNAVGSSIISAKKQAIDLSKKTLAEFLSNQVAKRVSANANSIGKEKQVLVEQTVNSSLKTEIVSKLDKCRFPLVLCRDFASTQKSKTGRGKLEDGMIEVQVELFYSAMEGNKIADEVATNALKTKNNFTQSEIKKLLKK